MEYIITIAVSVIASVLAFVVQQLMKDNKRLREERKAANLMKESNADAALVALLRAQMQVYHEKYVPTGRITSTAYEIFSDVYAAYSGMGANGVGTKMMQDVRGLKIDNK